MKLFCRLVLLTWAINWSKHLETLKRQRLKFHIVQFQCLASSGGSIFHLSLFNPNLDLTSLAENYSSLCEKSTENGWHTLLMHVRRKMSWLMHVAIFGLCSWSSHPLTKDTLITHHLILINLYFHFSQKQTNHNLATPRTDVPQTRCLWCSSGTCHGCHDNGDLETDQHNFYLTRQKAIGIKPCNCMTK